MFDLLLCGGKLYDGGGNAPYTADVAVRDGKIAAIGHDLGPAARTIDAAGFCVTPGFIDIHRHGDAEVFRPGFGRAELRQGLTTILNGACGVSLVPFGPRHKQELLHYLEPITGRLDPAVPTESLGTYLEALKKVRLPLNVGMMMGTGTVRADLFGYGEADPSDYRAIHRQLERGLADGAFGISLGLGYAPECFYTTQGLIRALEPLRNGTVPITVHMRQEGDGVCRSVEEMISVARELRCPVHISHLKAMGKRNWHSRIPEALELMKKARAEGLDVSCDVYLYDAGSTQLLHLLPPDFLKGGVDAICDRLRDETQRESLRDAIENRRDFDNIAQMVGWENIMLSALNLPEYQCLIGKTVAQAAGELNMDPVDCLCRLLADERCAVTMIDRMACEDDICTILQDRYASVISDSTYPSTGLPHPRVYGSYVRLIERFVLEKQAIRLPEAVRKVTSLPAETMGIAGKGRLQVGFDADINLFRPEDLRERATYLDPRRECEGMDTVIVGGTPAILHGQWTDARTGRVLARQK